MEDAGCIKQITNKKIKILDLEGLLLLLRARDPQKMVASKRMEGIDSYVQDSK